MSQPNNPIPLLPCPWCGSEDVETYWNDNCWVACNSCDAMGPGFEQGKNDKPEQRAITAWNNGPYVDRHEAHADALRVHAERLKAKAAEHLKKAGELLAKVKA